MSLGNDRETELLHRRDEILHETMHLTSDVVQSLEQQQKLARDTKENLHNQNVILSQANQKMRSMNEDLSSVVNEMNEIEAHHGCLCCATRRRKKARATASGNRKPTIIPAIQETTLSNPAKSTTIPELIDHNEQEKRIVQELNQMKTQFLVFQDQVQTINRSFADGDEIIHQLGNETDQYMNASSCLSRTERMISLPEHLIL